VGGAFLHRRPAALEGCHTASGAARQEHVGGGGDEAKVRASPSAEEVVAFGDRHGWPLIVKPSRGTASIGVTRVAGPAGTAEAMARAAGSADAILVETYLEGPQYSVETLSEDGEHEIVSITQKYSDPPLMIEMGQSLSAVLPAHVAEAIAAHVCATLTAVGVRTGPALPSWC
jgi:biotin carboxylase